MMYDERSESAEEYQDFFAYMRNNVIVVNSAYNAGEPSPSKESAEASDEDIASSDAAQTIEPFSPEKTYKQGDIVKLSGYSLGGEATEDQNTGRKGAVIFFSTDSNASSNDAQAIIMLDTTQATNAGTVIQCTAVCTVVGDDGSRFLQRISALEPSLFPIMDEMHQQEHGV